MRTPLVHLFNTFSSSVRSGDAFSSEEERFASLIGGAMTSPRMIQKKFYYNIYL
jgi:hypothetical protein